MQAAGRIVPGALREHALAVAQGRTPPAPARDAATVALVRDGADGLQVHLLRRVAGMAFAAGMHVFPGGSVDPEDRTAGDGLRWAGPAPADWGRAFGCDDATARALVCAAVRETFEETGVLLAGSTPDHVLADVSTDEWEAERTALEAQQQSLSALLGRRRLVLRSDLLRPLAHWTTPEVEPRRFDTRFFLARLPEGQVCREVGTEADARLWVRPADALARRLRMMPPTAAVLRDLALHEDAAASLAAARTVRHVQPRVVVDDDGWIRLVDG